MQSVSGNVDERPGTDSSRAPGELAVAKLTALWALSEGGLGGILHATRLPFRGVLLA